MGEHISMTLADIERLAFEALHDAGAAEAQARPLARAVAAAEADGIVSHGLAYVPTYCEHLRCGKVRGDALPRVDAPRPGLVTVDAGNGFAHAAIDAGFEALIPAARDQGIAACAVRESYNCGVLGHHTERLAVAGLLALGFTHAPASIAPVGGQRPVVGTNPFSVAVPDGSGGVALCIDQSASVIAKSEIMKHQREGRPIPEGWAFGPDGAPTTDATTALQGTMVPAGGYKGVGVALLVELLASAAAGAVSSRRASPFSGPAGGPPRTGQFFIAIDAGISSGGAFAPAVKGLLEAIAAQPGARIPGERRRRARERHRREGVTVARATLERIDRGRS